VFLFLVAVSLPPLVAFAVADVLGGDLLASLGMGTSLLVASGITVVWAAIVAVGASRVLGGEVRRMVELAERGTPAVRPDEAAGDAQRRLTSALDERNRQIAELAAQSRSAPISLDAPAVARSMVEAARGITGDPTWSLVVMRSRDAATLPSGVYDTEPGVADLDEVHRWATTLELDPHQAHGVRHADGPWGAFVVAEVAASEDLRAALLAPWEGRSAPSQVERELLGLVGQHAGMAIEHALLYARVRSQADELDRLARLQSDFLRGVSHDLQTPLTSIRALAEEVQATPDVPAQAQGDLDAIAHQADRLRRMVGQLLAMSRLESGALTPRSDVFRVEPIVERTWAALRADRPFALESTGAAFLAVGDPDRFEQALWAILDNAVKYAPPRTEVRVRVVPSGDTLMVEVQDQGEGMDDTTRARAFDQFFRAPAARAAVPDGSGIGLYTARGLMRAMGGDIVAEGGARHGSTMRMSLPAEPAGRA
jgi:signal transduction histidine kinase